MVGRSSTVTDDDQQGEGCQLAGETLGGPLPLPSPLVVPSPSSSLPYRWACITTATTPGLAHPACPLLMPTLNKPNYTPLRAAPRAPPKPISSRYLLAAAAASPTSSVLDVIIFVHVIELLLPLYAMCLVIHSPAVALDVAHPGRGGDCGFWGVTVATMHILLVLFQGESFYQTSHAPQAALSVSQPGGVGPCWSDERACHQC